MHPPKTLSSRLYLSLSFLSFLPKYIVYFIGFALLVSSVIFISGGSLKSAFPIVLVVLVLTILLTAWEFYYFHKLTIKRIVIYLVISNAIIVTSTIIASSFYDRSWDGMSYHQIAVLRLSEGWNPVYELLPKDPLKSIHYKDRTNLNAYVNHYPKAHEIFSALWVGLTGKLESGKVFNLLVIISAFCSAFYLLMGFPKFGITWALALALAATLNPITLSQLFSYCIDGALGSLLVIFIVQLIMLYHEEERKNSWPFLFTIFFTIIILCNIKFTALIYTILFCLLFIVWLLIIKRFVLIRKFCLVAIPAGILAVVVVGFNPYIINTRDYGHPFHPVAGNHKEDIIILNVPEGFINMNPMERLFHSTYSRSENFDSRMKGRLIQLKIPFVFDMKEIKAMQGEGIRLGGFGVLWSGIFSLALIFSGIAMYIFNGKKLWCMLALLIALAISVAINPEAWWARFVPQLWLFPVVVCGFLIYCDKPSMVRIAKCLIIIMIFNALVVAMVSMYTTIKTTILTERQFSQWRKSKKTIHVYFDIFTPNENKLKEENISFVKVNSLEELGCSMPSEVLKMHYCNQE